jgi:hypothetical protein
LDFFLPLLPLSSSHFFGCLVVVSFSFAVADSYLLLDSFSSAPAITTAAEKKATINQQQTKTKQRIVCLFFFFFLFLHLLSDLVPLFHLVNC